MTTDKLMVTVAGRHGTKCNGIFERPVHRNRKQVGRSMLGKAEELVKSVSLQTREGKS